MNLIFLPIRWLSRKLMGLVLLGAFGLLAAGVLTGAITHLGPLDVEKYSATAIWDDVSDAVLDGVDPGTDGRVVRVVDGDTLLVRISGKTERVRVLGIDTPETKKPGTAIQCFGPEATANAKRWVSRAHQRVTLKGDPAAPDRDRHGRLLRYVEPRGTGADLSLEQVAEGYGKVAAYGQDLVRLGKLERAETAAKRRDRGRWGSC